MGEQHMDTDNYIYIHTYIHLNHCTRAEHGAWSNKVILESGILISHDEKTLQSG